MKKILFILLFVGVTCYGQSNDLPLNQRQNQNRTEIKFNALSVAFGAIDFELERTLTENSSVGIGFLTKFGDPIDGISPFNYDSAITGFYRHYFGKKYAQGLFLEGFGRFHVSEKFSSEYESNLLIGLGVGYKHVFKNGIILQADFGVGKNVFIDNKFLGKGGISVGFQF